jgi:CubicO group peptidase (beta-lactamase class C family)
MNCPGRLIGVIGLACVLARLTAHAGELPTSTPAAEGLSEEKLQKVHEIMNGLVRDRHIAGGIVLIARHGKVVFREPYGLMHLDDERPIERDTIFRIYSMSKAITSAAALVLVDDGKLELTAPVSRYLPEFAKLKVLDGEEERPARHEMTVTDLIRHTSGITYGNPAGDGVEKMFETLDVLDLQSDLAVMTAKLGQMPLSFDPGADWKYGASIDVLGRVIEVASGQPLDEFLRERIFTPLGMSDTGFYVPPDKRSRFASNYYSDGEGRLIIRDEPTKSMYLRKQGLLSGGGGLVGTAADYMRFLLMVEGDGQLDGARILSARSVQLMTTNQLPKDAGWVTFGENVRTGVGFGLGFSVTVEPDEANPHARRNEYGWGGAASTHYWVSPGDELIVVTMEQRMPYSPETENLLKPVIYDAIVE